MENEESKIISEEETTDGPGYQVNEHLERFFHFAKLAGLNFMRILFGISLLVLCIFSAYRLIITYHVFSALGRIISTTGLSGFSTLPHALWIWFFILLASWSCLTALYGRRI